MQTLFFDTSFGEEVKIELPDENNYISKNIKWGRVEAFFTPAFWYSQTIMHEKEKSKILNFNISNGALLEETLACLIGGYGIPSEIGNSKFNQIRPHIYELFSSPNLEKITQLMKKPILHDNKQISYRFAQQKAKYIYNTLLFFQNFDETIYSDIALRNQLMTIKGIGPKTASWIVRNYRKSDCVAIIDIHLHRAGILAGFFDFKDNINKDYIHMEKKFLEFCSKINLSAAKVDAVIWRIMKTLNSIVLEQIELKKLIA